MNMHIYPVFVAPNVYLVIWRRNILLIFKSFFHVISVMYFFLNPNYFSTQDTVDHKVGQPDSVH